MKWLVGALAMVAAVAGSTAAEGRRHYPTSVSAGARGSNGYYTAKSGNRVSRPVRAPNPPAGASAQCRDGSWSFSESRRGTCSRHGGVARWL